MVHGTATDRLPFPLSLPGMYSSSTAWKLVPPKPKALNAGAPDGICRNRPRLQFGVDIKRGVSKVDIRTGMLAMQTGRQHLIAKRQCCFQQSGGARGAFQMSDVRFDRAESNRARREDENC